LQAQRRSRFADADPVDVRRAVAVCPALALRIESVTGDRARS
jgi:hypothetical protein